MKKNNCLSKEEQEKAKKLAMFLTTLDIEDLQKLFWIMQGMKLASY